MKDEDTCVISISLLRQQRFQKFVTLRRCHVFGCVSRVQTPSYKIVRVFLLEEMSPTLRGYHDSAVSCEGPEKNFLPKINKFLVDVETVQPGKIKLIRFQRKLGFD